MKVKDIINTRTDMPTIKSKIIVKPRGTEKQYYNSESNNYLPYQIAEMEVETWFIIPIKKNQFDLVIIVARNKEYEEEKQKSWERLIWGEIVDIIEE